MKLSLFKVLFIVSLLGIGIYIWNERQDLKKEVCTLRNNQKAFIAENSSLKDESRAFKFTIEQLNYYNDSILQKMNNVRKELSIKDKNLKQMQYLLSEATKKDTIVFRDTLFREPTLDIDTLVGDKWYNIRLGLKYPNLITTNPTFISEKYIIVNKKKETINPPKKFFLFRWFQKKHTILEVNMVEKNPYIENKNNRFIEIIK